MAVKQQENILRIKFSSKIKDFMEGKYRYRCAYGGRGSGKSYPIHLQALIKATEKPLTVLCCRETMTSLKESVHSLLEELIETYGLGGEDGFTVLENKITHQNGSKFIYAGLRTNPDAVKSINGVDICIVEEASSVSKDSWKKLTPSIRAEDSEIWVIWNPDKETDPVHQMFIVDPPSNAKIVKSTYLDNPHCPQVLIDDAEECKRKNYEEYKATWLGGLNTKSEAQVFAGYYSVQEFDTPEDIDFLWGADWGFSTDPSTLIRCFIVGKKLYIDAEAYKHHVETVDLPEFFKTIPGSDKGVIYGDSARPENISHLNKNGYRVKSVAKGKGSVEAGISAIKGFDEVIIHKRCTKTTEEFRHYSYKVHRQTGEVLPELVDKFNHMIDALRYALEPYFRAKGGARMRLI